MSEQGRECSFDEVLRRGLAEAVIRALRSGPKSLRILALDGQPNGAGFGESGETVSTDLSPWRAAREDPATDLQLPYETGSFDLVLGLDVLRSVQPNLLEAFLRECTRVTRAHVVLAGPFDTEQVRAAERSLARFTEEHVGHDRLPVQSEPGGSLPALSLVRGRFESLGARVADYPHTPLDHWLLTSCLDLYLDQDDDLRSMAGKIRRFFNRFRPTVAWGEPSYRHVVMAAVQGARLPSLDDIRGGEPIPTGTVSELGPLDTEQQPIDRLISRWDEILGDAGAYLRDLARAIESQDAAIQDVRGPVDELRAVEAEVADLRGEIDALRSTLSSRWECFKRAMRWQPTTDDGSIRPR